MSFLLPKKSKFKNLAGSQCIKNQIYTNLKDVQKQSGGESEVVSVNENFFAIPWSLASVLVVHRKNDGQKILDPATISGHKDLISDTQFSPFKTELLATASNDATVRLWNLPSEGLKTKIMQEDVCFIHPKKVNIVKFHPTASDILLTSSGDFKTRLWDINSPKEPFFTDEHHTDTIQSYSWNNDGSAFVSSCKDGILRIMDPRTGSLLVHGKAHESTKGFRACWLGKNEKIATIGFNKQRGREYAYWDIRKGFKNGPITRATIDTFPTQCWMYFDPGNNILYTAGKGDSIIKFYEINDSAPFIHYISEFKSSRSQSGLAMIPQRFNDTNKCEIAKFMKLTGSELETISFQVPRKDSNKILNDGDKKVEIFQEDIYPDVYSGKPSLTAKEYLKGNDKPPVMSSMKKEQMVSVYEVPIDSGGKVKPTETKTFGKGQIEGSLIMLTPPKKKESCFVSMKIKEILIEEESKKSKKSNTSIPIASVLSVHKVKGLTNDPEDDILTFQFCTTERMYYFIADNEQERNKWIKTISKNLKRSYQNEEAIEDQFFQGQANKSKIKGWNSRYLYSINNYLFIFTSKYDVIPEEKYSMNDLKSVQDFSEYKGIKDKEKNLILQINTKKKTDLTFLANTETQKDKWLEYLQNIFSPTPDNDNLLQSLGLVSENMRRASVIPSKIGESAGSIQVFPISPNVVEQDISDLFGIFGTITSIKFYREKKFPGIDEDLVLITFSKEMDAEKAVALNGISMEEQRVTVQVYVKEQNLDPLYIKIDKIPLETSILDINDVFSCFSEIESIRLWYDQKNTTDPSNAKHKIAYIKFANREESLPTLGLDGMKFYDKPVKLSELKGRIDEDELFLNEVNPIDVKNGLRNILLQMKGKKRIRSKVVLLNVNSLNSSDVFILDAGMKVFQWNGKKASKFKKARGLDVTTNIRVKDRSGTAKAIILDEGKEAEYPNEFKEFWKLISGKSETQQVELTDGQTDIEAEKEIDKNTILYRIYKKSGKFKLKKIAEDQDLSKEMLKSEYVFILDCLNEIHIWEGKESSAESKKMAKKIAMKFEVQSRRPFWVTTTRHIEMGETVIFKEKFIDFPSILPIGVQASSLGSKAGSTVSKKLVQKKITPEDLISLKDSTMDDIFDNGTGTSKIWKVEGFEKEEYPIEMYGRFFSGDSYIILYTYQKKNKNYNLIYFWQGRDSTVNEKGASALLSVNLSEITSGETLQIRCLQQQENEHFLSIFNPFSTIHAPYMVHYGKYKNYSKENEIEVFDVRESNSGYLRAIGISPKKIKLHSNGCVLLKRKNEVFLRIGKNATKKEIQYSKDVAKILSKNSPKEIKEGSGDILVVKFGKENLQNYPSSQRKKSRLFKMNGQSGVVEFEEVYDFSQYDLNQKDVFILDNGEFIYCWYGNEASFYTRKFSLELAVAYSKKVKSTKVYVVKCFGEPIEFTSLFQGWEKWSWKTKLKVDTQLLDSEYFIQEYSRKTYSYNELLEEKLPEGLDATKLETYLGDDEFMEVFSMDREKFNKLPKFKQQNLKKEVYLF
eukprot:gene2213-2387_t